MRLQNSQAITASTALTGVFGDPIEHSRSPAMHNAAYAALRMDRAYVAFRVSTDGLPSALRAVQALGIVGVNLTVPLKERAIRIVDELSGEARILGAVNCIVNRRGTLHGDNTDARGLERDLRELNADLRRGTSIVIGAGGGAAAAVLACLRLRARRIVIANRTIARAVALAGRFARHRTGKAEIVAHGLEALIDRELLAEAAIIVNATPMGLTTSRFAPLNYPATPADCLFYDLVYAREPTVFLKPALAIRRRAIDGAGMLVNQGELAFRLLNGVAAPSGVMRDALWRELSRA